MGRRRKLLVVVAAVYAVLLGCGYLDRVVGGYDGPAATDAQAMAQWRAALAPALADLNAAPGLEGMASMWDADVHPCSRDSGALFDITANRRWAPTGEIKHAAPQALATLLPFVVGRGWSVQHTERRRVVLTKRLSRHLVTLDLDAGWGELWASLSYPHAPSGCHAPRD